MLCHPALGAPGGAGHRAAAGRRGGREGPRGDAGVHLHTRPSLAAVSAPVPTTSLRPPCCAAARAPAAPADARPPHLEGGRGLPPRPGGRRAPAGCPPGGAAAPGAASRAVSAARAGVPPPRRPLGAHLAQRERHRPAGRQQRAGEHGRRPAAHGRGHRRHRWGPCTALHCTPWPWAPVLGSPCNPRACSSQPPRPPPSQLMLRSGGGGGSHRPRLSLHRAGQRSPGGHGHRAPAGRRGERRGAWCGAPCVQRRQQAGDWWALAAPN